MVAENKLVAHMADLLISSQGRNRSLFVQRVLVEFTFCRMQSWVRSLNS